MDTGDLQICIELYRGLNTLNHPVEKRAGGIYCLIYVETCMIFIKGFGKLEPLTCANGSNGEENHTPLPCFQGRTGNGERTNL